MVLYQLSFLDPIDRVQVAYMHYDAEDDADALRTARRRHFYLPAELRRSGELVASFEQEGAPADPTTTRTPGKRDD